MNTNQQLTSKKTEKEFLDEVVPEIETSNTGNDSSKLSGLAIFEDGGNPRGLEVETPVSNFDNRRVATGNSHRSQSEIKNKDGWIPDVTTSLDGLFANSKVVPIVAKGNGYSSAGLEKITPLVIRDGKVVKSEKVKAEMQPGEIVSPKDDPTKEVTVVEQTPEGKLKIKDDTGNEVVVDAEYYQQKLTSRKKYPRSESINKKKGYIEQDAREVIIHKNPDEENGYTVFDSDKEETYKCNDKNIEELLNDLGWNSDKIKESMEQLRAGEVVRTGSIEKKKIKCSVCSKSFSYKNIYVDVETPFSGYCIWFARIDLGDGDIIKIGDKEGGEISVGEIKEVINRVLKNPISFLSLPHENEWILFPSGDKGKDDLICNLKKKKKAGQYRYIIKDRDSGETLDESFSIGGARDMLIQYTREGKNPVISLASMEKKEDIKKTGYVKHCPGHKGSDGELREWCVMSHKTDKVMKSFKTEDDANKAIQRMHTFGDFKKIAIVPDAIDFKYIEEKMIFGPESEEYKLLEGITEDSWEQYLDSRLEYNVKVEYDNVEDIFTIIPTGAGIEASKKTAQDEKKDKENETHSVTVPKELKSDIDLEIEEETSIGDISKGDEIVALVDIADNVPKGIKGIVDYVWTDEGGNPISCDITFETRDKYNTELSHVRKAGDKSKEKKKMKTFKEFKTRDDKMKEGDYTPDKVASKKIALDHSEKYPKDKVKEAPEGTGIETIPEKKVDKDIVPEDKRISKNEEGVWKDFVKSILSEPDVASRVIEKLVNKVLSKDVVDETVLTKLDSLLPADDVNMDEFLKSDAGFKLASFLIKSTNYKN